MHNRKFQGHRSIGSGEDFTIKGHVAMLVMRYEPFGHIFVPLAPGDST